MRRRLALAIACAVVLLGGTFSLGLGFGSLFGASTAGTPHATAEGVPAVFFGFVPLDQFSAKPTRVRALIGDTVCGTASLQPSGEGLAFYVLSVVPAADKAGCGTDGVPVRFLLLAGEVDPGTPAAQTQAWKQAGQRVDLSPAASNASFGSFVGQLPAGRGFAMVRWTGRSGTPVEQAVLTLGRRISALYHWNVERQRFDAYIPGALAVVQGYSAVDTDDIVFVGVE